MDTRNIAPRALALLTCLSLSPAVMAEDLWDVYQLALQNDPIIREAQATRDAAVEARPQAFGAMLPNISGRASLGASHTAGSNTFLTTIDDDANPATPEVAVTGTSAFRSDTDSSWQWSITLTQSVFSWGNWQALRRADAAVAQAEADYAAARQSLIQRVATAYFNVLAAQDELDAVTANFTSLERQLEQTQKRFEVGLIAITDVQESQAAYDTAAADEIAARRSLSSAREALRELTNVYVDDLQRPEGAIILTSPDPTNMQAWVDLAINQNLSIISSRLATDIAFRDMRSSYGGYMPSLDFSATHSLSDSDAQQGVNGGAYAPSNSHSTTDSVSLVLNVPFFDGLQTNSRIRQSSASHIAAKERLVQAQRRAERDTRDAYLGVLSEIRRVQALERALESNETAMAATEAGFEVGTRTTVDVLNARQALTRARTNYLTSRYTYINTLVSLELAAGMLDEADVERINDWLN